MSAKTNLPKYMDKALIKAVVMKIKSKMNRQLMDRHTDGITRFSNIDGAGKLSRF